MRKIYILCIICSQIFIVLSICIVKEYHIRTGRTIIVKTVPVDPRSIFRGDYVYLNYIFSHMDLNKLPHSDDRYYSGKRVYVKLLKKDDDWIPVYISGKPYRNLGEDEIVISGLVLRNFRNKIFVRYGIESYFVPEGKGKYLQELIRKKRLTVEASIDRWGYACVRRIFVNGKEIEFR